MRRAGKRKRVGSAPRVLSSIVPRRYRLEAGELLCGEQGRASEHLGAVSGAVVTSDDRLEFTIYTEYKTRSFAFRALTLHEMTRWLEACERAAVGKASGQR